MYFEKFISSDKVGCVIKLFLWSPIVHFEKFISSDRVGCIIKLFL